MKKTHDINKLVVAAGVATCLSLGSVGATTILFDLGQTANTTGAAGWNNFAWATNSDASVPITIADLVDSAGLSTGIGATISVIETNGHGQGGFTGSGATISPEGTSYDASVADHLWVPNGQVYTLVLSDLSASASYNFTFGISMPGGRTDYKTVNFDVTGLNNGSGSITEATVEGGGSSSVAGWYWSEIDGISPDGSNEITLTATGTGNSGRWSSLEITVVPEPSSAALLCLGGLALMLRRR